MVQVRHETYDNDGNLLTTEWHPQDPRITRNRELRAKIREFARGNRGGISLPALAEIVFSLAALMDEGFDDDSQGG